MTQQANRGAVNGLMLSSLLVLATGAQAEAVFDGSIGPQPPGTLRSGNFEIGEADGQLNGSNLFHSLEIFNVNAGESATFSHTTNGVQNIITRVSGTDPTQIRGAMQTRQFSGGSYIPTSATLWLMNPNGIVIGDGAFFDPASSFRLSTTNRLGFDNGESFYTHELSQTSSLSVANPASFGFLDNESLPGGVTPAGIEVSIEDVADTNNPLFLANMVLVGTSTDASTPGLTINGDLATAFDINQAFAAANSSQIQAYRLSLYALGVGATLDFNDPSPAASGVALSDIAINNANLFLTDNGAVPNSALYLSANDLNIDNSFVQTAANSGASPLQIDVAGFLQVTDSALKTTTLGSTDAGSLIVGASDLSATGSFIGSQVADLGVPMGASGDVAIGLGSGRTLTRLNLDNDVIASENLANNDSGDVRLNANNIQADSSLVYSLGANSTGAGGGTIEWTADAEGITITDTSMISASTGTGAGGDILLRSQGDLVLLSSTGVESIETSTAGNTNSGNIELTAAGDVRIEGGYRLVNNTTASGNAGDITISGRNVALAGADTGIELFSATLSQGQSGQITLNADNTLQLADLTLYTVSDAAGSAGSIELIGERVQIADTSLFSSTLGSNPNSAPATITIQAQEQVQINNASLQSNTGGAAPAGRILIESAADINLSQISLQSVSTADGLAGDVQIVGGNTVRIAGDETLIAANATGTSAAGDIGLRAARLELVDGATVQTVSEGSGNAGTIQMDAADIYLNSVRVESGSINAGGGDIKLFGDQIVLDGDTRAGGIVFLFADSQASDPQGNGGSITLGDPDQPASVVVIRSAALTASAAQGNGGQININADALLRDASSLFLVTSESAEAGDLEINAQEQDISAAVTELNVELLDASNLIQSVCDRNFQERSSLTITPRTNNRQRPDDYYATANAPTNAVAGFAAAALIACHEPAGVQ